MEFYKKLLPHKKIIGSPDSDQVFLVFDNGSALGLWKKGAIGLHNGRGAEHLHFAFQIKPDEYIDYKNRLEALNVEVLEHSWSDGHRSLYFFDPDGHQGEFMTKDWL